MSTATNDPYETGGTFPTPGKNATLEELRAAYAEIEASDAPEFLKQRLMMDLGDKVREYGKQKKPEPMGHGEMFVGAPAETVAKSDFAGRLLTDDGMVRARSH